MYGLIGKKLGHSFSAVYFNEKFQREGINESYHLFPLEKIEDFPDLLKSNPELKGLNVTIPYKEQIKIYLDSLSQEAKSIGAVNVIKIFRQGEDIKLKGFNSDIVGFKNSLIPLLSPSVKSALILGTGGASKAVAYVLNKLGIDFKFVSRNPCEGQLGYNDLTEEVVKRNLLIINTTPVGMYPDDKSYPDIPYWFLTENHLCYDLVYNPLETEFMKKAQEHGATVKNGLEMLEGQAIEAWRIWSGNENEL